MTEVFEPVIGTTYGQTTVKSGPYSNNGRYWNCVCVCGKESVKTITSIRLARDTGKGGCNGCSTAAHGYGSSKNPTYARWQALKSRCNDKAHKSYPDYGGRGIKVCDRWLNSFENFLADMGEVPGPEYTTERIDTNGNYEPENCRWATKLEQANNARSNMAVVVNEIEFPTLSAACRHFGMKYSTARMRVCGYGWTPQRAVTEPIDTSKRKKSCWPASSSSCRAGSSPCQQSSTNIQLPNQKRPNETHQGTAALHHQPHRSAAPTLGA